MKPLFNTVLVIGLLLLASLFSGTAAKATQTAPRLTALSAAHFDALSVTQPLKFCNAGDDCRLDGGHICATCGLATGPQATPDGADKVYVRPGRARPVLFLIIHIERKPPRA